jgi:hypothetical protein
VAIVEDERITSAFVCASLGIVPTVRHADYIGSWLEVLREDNRAIVRAASAASKAADYLLAFLPGASEPGDASNPACEQEMAGSMPLRDGGVVPADRACRDTREGEEGRGFRDGLEVEREALGRPSRRNRHDEVRSEDHAQRVARHSL